MEYDKYEPAFVQRGCDVLSIFRCVINFAGLERCVICIWSRI